MWRSTALHPPTSRRAAIDSQVPSSDTTLIRTVGISGQVAWFLVYGAIKCANIYCNNALAILDEKPRLE